MFTGWTQVGYWRNGELLTRGEFRNSFYRAQVVIKNDQSAHQASVTTKRPAKTGYEPAGREFTEWLASIPTLDQWKRQSA